MLALCLLTSFFAPRSPELEVAGHITLATRISDSETVKPRQQHGHSHAHPHAHMARPLANPVTAQPHFPHQPDVTPSSIDFDQHSLDTLIRRGQLTLDHPEGGELVLTLEARRVNNGIETLSVRSDGLPGTITTRGNSFFATLATHRGVYAIEHRHGRAQLIDQRQLDLRITRPDYAHVPTV